jgi:ABC-2 type transport system ATP-binding protein
MIFSGFAQNIGKKYGNEWIFRNFSCDFQLGNVYVFTGSNGSGKSTLLKILAGMLSPSTGKMGYVRGKMLLPPDYWFRNISYAAPYIDLIEEFTLAESIAFHAQFKKMSIDQTQILEELALPKATNKPIKYFSSGMKQKVKLALNLFSTTPLLFLDEPTANFDQQNAQWYREKLQHYPIKDRILVIASNMKEEYEFLPNTLFEMKNYK